MPIRTTARTPAAQRLDYWRDILRHSFAPLEVLPMDLAPPGAFHAEVRAASLADVRVATVTAGPHLVRRTPSLIARDADEHYQLSLQLRGSCAVMQDGQAEVLATNELMLLDCTRPFQLMFDDSHQMLCFGLPRRLLPFAPERVAALTATPLSGRDGVGALLAAFMAELATQVHANAIASPGKVAANLLNLTETLLIERSADDLGQCAPAPQLPRIKLDIEFRLGPDKLSLDELAAAHHISPARLEALFAAQDTSAAAWITGRRLERCRRDLGDPACALESVATIAARWGLRDDMAFRRLFAARFHLAPEECRPASAGGVSA